MFAWRIMSFMKRGFYGRSHTEYRKKKTEKLTMKTIVLPKSLFIFQNIPFCVNTLYKSLNKLQKVSVDQTI